MQQLKDGPGESWHQERRPPLTIVLRKSTNKRAILMVGVGKFPIFQEYHCQLIKKNGNISYVPKPYVKL